MPAKPCPGLAQFPPEFRLQAVWATVVWSGYSLSAVRPSRVLGNGSLGVFAVLRERSASMWPAQLPPPNRKTAKRIQICAQKTASFLRLFGQFLTKKRLLYLPINNLRNAHFLRDAVLKSGGVAASIGDPCEPNQGKSNLIKPGPPLA